MVAGPQNTDSRFDIGTSMLTVLYTVCQEIRKMECFWQTIAQTLVKERSIMPIPAIEIFDAKDYVWWRKLIADFLGTHGHSHFVPSSLSSLCVSVYTAVFAAFCRKNQAGLLREPE